MSGPALHASVAGAGRMSGLALHASAAGADA